MAYHISPNGPSLCRAKQGRCPYGAFGQNHFATVGQASRFYEMKMTEAFGGFEVVTKTGKQQRKEKAYNFRDRFAAVGRSVKTSSPVAKSVEALNAVRHAPVASVMRAKELSSKAWRSLGKVAYSANSISKDAAREIAVARQRYSAYTARVGAANEVRYADYQKHVAQNRARRTEAKLTEETLGGRLKPTSASRLRVGDKLEGGSTITKLKTLDGSLKVTTRNMATGHFGKSLKLSPSSSIGVVRPRRQLMRQAGEAYKNTRAITSHRIAVVANSALTRSQGYLEAARSRLKLAEPLQRQSLESLIGIDRRAIQWRGAPARNLVQDIRSLLPLRSAL